MKVFYPARLHVGSFGLAAWLAVVVLARGEDPIPTAFPPGHFDKLAMHSPFSPPTLAPSTPVSLAPVGPKPFEKYTVTSLMQQGNDYIATLSNKENSEHTRVRSNKENDEGLMLAGVEWSNEPTQTKVTLRKGTEFGVVSFDPTNLTAPALAIPGMPGRMVPPTTNFRPPPGVAPGAGGAAGVQPTGNTVRRPSMIQSPVPPPRSGPFPGQPGVNFTNAPQGTPPPIPGAVPGAARITPAATLTDDDDDN